MNRQDLLGNTQLHKAVIQNDIPRVIQLLKQNIDYNIKNYVGKSAIFYTKTPEMLAEILKYAGADILTVFDNEGKNPALANEIVRKCLDLLK